MQTTQTLDENDIHELLTETADEEGVMPTFIDRYIEQGRQQGLFVGMEKGMEQGMEKGRQEGEQNERRALLLRLLTRKFGAPTPAQRRRIKQADGETLLRWVDQLLFAATADEALR